MTKAFYCAEQGKIGTSCTVQNKILISMYDKSDKRRLYWLIDQYLSDKIDEPVFCDEFYYSYDLEIADNTLTDIEKVAFAELSTVAGRFSEYEEDHLGLPNGFYTVEELRQKRIATKEKLGLVRY